MPAAWKVHQRAVFGHDPVDKVEIAGYTAEVNENAAGDKEHCHVAKARIGDGIQYRRGHAVLAGNGPVVVQRQDGKLHAGVLSSLLPVGRRVLNVRFNHPQRLICAPRYLGE